MKWTEPDYMLLQELNSMSNRILAQMIELTAFPTSHEGKHWQDFVDLLMGSEDQSHFEAMAATYIKSLGAKFSVSESAWQQSYDKVCKKLGIDVSITAQPFENSMVVLLNGRDL